MSGFRLSQIALDQLDQLDQIYDYTLRQWGKDQAEKYILGLFEAFERIAADKIVRRRISAELEVDGYFFRYEHHFIYWRKSPGGLTDIVTILHQKMHLASHLKNVFFQQDQSQ